MAKSLLPPPNNPPAEVPIVAYRLIGWKHCQDTDIVKFGTYKGRQRYFCKACKRKFSDTSALPYQCFPPEQVGTAISLFYRGLSFKKAGEQVAQGYSVPPPSKSTVYRWAVAYTKEALKDIGRPKFKTGDTFVADEMLTTIGGRKYWIWTVMDIDSRAVLANHISRTRTTRDAEALFRRAKESTTHPPKRIITDGLDAYTDGIERVFGADSLHTRHVLSKGLTSESNNNLMERLNGTIRERTKVMRGLQDPESARLILDGWALHYNYFRPHESLNGRTPAEEAGVEIPFKDWPDVARNPFPTHHLTARGIPKAEIPEREEIKERELEDIKIPLRRDTLTRYRPFRVRRMGR
jgi:putative transposase